MTRTTAIRRSVWEEVGRSGLVQVAEQYLLMPGHAARLHVVREGVIGEPTAALVCSTHLYHAVSLIRGLLGVGFEPAVVHARAFTAPLADPLTPDGWTSDATPQPRTTTIATLDFGGRMGVASLLERTGAWARGEGPEPYPLAEGLQDHLLSVAIQDAATRGLEVRTGHEAWAG